MFEGALVESRGETTCSTVRWAAFGSLALQSGVATLLVALPLLHPGQLSRLTSPPQVITPAVASVPKNRVTVRLAAKSSPSIASLATKDVLRTGRDIVQQLLPGRTGTSDPAPTGRVSLSGMGASSALAEISTVRLDTSRVTRAVSAGPVRISSGVSSGLLLTPIRPLYPATARAARVQGTVSLEALISNAGRIEKIQVLSGPEMLRRAALDAVQAARYQPYTLNGQPVAVETVITVKFQLAD